MKADTSGTFNKSQLYFWCFDGDRHQPPKVQICRLVLRALPTDAFPLKSQRCSEAHVNVPVTAYFIRRGWGGGVPNADVVKERSQQPKTTDADGGNERQWKEDGNENTSAGKASL